MSKKSTKKPSAKKKVYQPVRLTPLVTKPDRKRYNHLTDPFYVSPAQDRAFEAELRRKQTLLPMGSKVRKYAKTGKSR